MLRGVMFGIFLMLILSLSFGLLHYKKSYEFSIKDLQVSQVQNEILKADLLKRELKLKEYLAQKPKIEEKIITKYKLIKQKDESCQSFKEGVYEMLGAFYDGTNHPPP